MTPADVLRFAIDPAMEIMWDIKTDVPGADRFLLAIAMQESGLMEREQISGPARGLWQFEGPTCELLLLNPLTHPFLVAACDRLSVFPSALTIYRAIEFGDTLAAFLARLLLWADPHPLPWEETDAWRTYLRVWRPGKPRVGDWPANWAAAVAATPTLTS